MLSISRLLMQNFRFLAWHNFMLCISAHYHDNAHLS
ncbi:protein of unknown function [Latilactobacillus sakei]|nr:protein of unknown function [Latilactobacillus sakei]